MNKTAAIAAALTLGVSSLAMAQTSAPTQSAKPGASSTGTTAPSASSGTSTTQSSGSGASGKMNAADLKSHLEKEGYSGVTDIQPDANGYTARATRDGKEVSLNIDAAGKVSQAR